MRRPGMRPEPQFFANFLMVVFFEVLYSSINLDLDLSSELGQDAIKCLSPGHAALFKQNKG